ncbi:MAG: alpha-galactosidase [Vicinamibacteria bacterium]|nr:alpha-galactosidase [Vicinamibacteria bacterium]
MRVVTPFLCLGLLTVAARTDAQSLGEPPNVAATLSEAAGRMSLTYEGRPIVAGAVNADPGATAERRMVADESNGALTQVIKWTARGKGRITLDLEVQGSADAIAVEADRTDSTLPIVRSSIGPSHNRRNRAVYDRARDWTVSIDAGAELALTPMATSAARASFRLQATGLEIVLRFRPRFYQKHRGLKYFQPWTYQPWKGSVTGWTSWYAFRDKVTQKDVAETAAVIAETLAPFGYEYVQIDDGFQQDPIGVPDHWLKTNDKFPGGLDGLKKSIVDRSLKPGLWTNVSFAQADYALAHPGYFVPGPDGKPAYGNWVGYVMDGSNPKTLADLVTPVYRSLVDSGWQYFKVDALRHLRYEGYNSFGDYFARRHLDREAVFRQFASSITSTLGPKVFKLMCWGVRPELIGLFDGCRLGNDGFGYGGFSEYNSFNNIVWRNDPDHIELTQPDAYRATTLTSLTGSILMLTDPPAVYRTDRVEAARRTSPVLFAQPGQIYDVEPSRSNVLSRAAVEMSGSGPRTFDATQALSVHYLHAIDVSRPYEQWMVLARTGGDSAPIRFADLGLAADRDYLAFEFWTKSFLGSFRETFMPGDVDPRFGVQVFCLRERTTHPQLVATNRHVSCGAMDISNLSWSPGSLEGISSVVGGDPYELYLTEPAGYSFVNARVEGALVSANEKVGSLRRLRLLSARNGEVRWRLDYRVDAP